MDSIITSSVADKQATTQQQPSQQPTVPGQPWRTMSTVERDLPTWLRDTMNGKSSNGTFSGRGAK